MRRAGGMLAAISAGMSGEVPLGFFQATAETEEEAEANYQIAKSRAAWSRDSQDRFGIEG